ncbi:hypothetical protein [Streptomyces sp. C]|uniref:hypothetical protein n=1 Tax=Streptomyces sp. C TaxID=253839 RepID=UPI0001DEFB66|nr:hypothetical protein [Streptomyces sp. C]EFL19914.1 predicted protein [Streptomyces sp. C]
MKPNRVRRARLECGRCRKPAPQDWTSPEATDWSGRWERGRLAFVLCPPCHSPVEVAEAELNAVGIAVAQDQGGRFLADPVVCLTGTWDAPGQVLYGRDHLQRIMATGTINGLGVVERLPVGTRCVATAGGVLIYERAVAAPPEPGMTAPAVPGGSSPMPAPGITGGRPGEHAEHLRGVS